MAPHRIRADETRHPLQNRVEVRELGCGATRSRSAMARTQTIFKVAGWVLASHNLGKSSYNYHSNSPASGGGPPIVA